jgi:hypothetical protein
LLTELQRRGITHGITSPQLSRRARRLATEQAHHRLTGRLAERVPERHVQSGHHHAQQSLKSEKAELALELLLARQRDHGLAPQQRRQLVHERSQRP